MLKLITLLVATAALLSGCGYDGHYRYPCQDPANWEKAECNPPICEATGTCTKDLINTDVTTTDEPIEETTNE